MAAASELMAAGGQLAMSCLDGVPLRFRFSADDRASIALARTLLRLDLASADDWEVANRDPAAYVLVTLDRLIAAHGGASIKRRFDLYATLTSYLDEYSERNEADPDGSRLYLMVEPDRCGFVVLNPTVQLLEEANPRLPATFYGLFAGALNNWIRVYDYREAQERVTMWREWMEGEPDAEQYEIPDVEKCIPACMRQRPLSRQKLRAMRAKVEAREARNLLQPVLELVDISERATRPELTDEMREELCDTNPALPSLLAVFAERDAIEACFDDEGQTALEVGPEPSVIIPLNAHEPESVRQAFHTFGVLCDTLAAASRVIDRMPGNERSLLEHRGVRRPSMRREYENTPGDHGGNHSWVGSFLFFKRLHACFRGGAIDQPSRRIRGPLVQFGGHSKAFPNGASDRCQADTAAICGEQRGAVTHGDAHHPL